jgi:hypothetical protein
MLRLSSSTSGRTNAQIQSENLFRGMSAYIGHAYLALPDSYITESDNGEPRIMESSPATLTSGLLSTEPCYRSDSKWYRDKRLQNNVFYLWHKFRVWCEDRLRRGPRYVVEKPLHFLVVCVAGQTRFTCRYVGNGVFGLPRSENGWERHYEDNDREGEGLRGNPKALQQVGDSILVRLKGPEPLDAHAYVPDSSGKLPVGFYIPCQFAHIQLLAKNATTGETRYRVTYLPSGPTS